MSYVFTCGAQWPLDSNRSSFLGCCTARSREAQVEVETHVEQAAHMEQEALEEEDGEEDDGEEEEGAGQGEASNKSTTC
jgi:hypothetical protein